MAAGATLVWIRQDLRVEDHPALRAGASAGGAVVPVWIWAPEEEGRWAPGGASRWWLDRSLASLAQELAGRGSRLVLARGPSSDRLLALARQCGAARVFWSRRYEPAAAARDRATAAALRAAGLETREFPGALLHDPERLLTRGGGPYKVFTPFWRALAAGQAPAPPLPAPSRLPAPAAWPVSVPLVDLELAPRPDWAGGLRAVWRPGTKGAASLLRRLRREIVGGYEQARDLLDREGTSRLSPHLHFGEVSPRQVWHAAGGSGDVVGAGGADGVAAYRRQLVWREFAHHLLHHFPETPEEPLRPEFADLPWREDTAALRAWRRGRTGYPLVDAGMRELWATGWMHNRARMVASSFLVKHLLLPWQTGARWFWDTLVDADLANNTLGWQWTAGCGADAAPFFRIFNPVRQGERFDAGGGYVRRWVPELARLPARWLHRPWAAPPAELEAAGVSLGRDYPAPLVEHERARRRALAALAEMARRR